MLKRFLLLLTAIILAAVPAAAQNTLLQGGAFTAGHAPMYVIGGQGQAIVQDSGPAGGGALGSGLSELLITARGSGTAPYAGQGTGPNGEIICAYDAPIDNATGYHYLCLSANAQSGGLISYGAGGGASTLPLNFLVNGTLTACCAGGGSGITALTGDVTASGTGSVAASVVRLQGRNVASTAPTNGQVLTWSSGSSQWQPGNAGSGSVTSVASGTGLTGGPITTTGTLSLANTAVTPATYGNSTNVAQFTVDAQGRITSAANVAISTGGGGTVTSVTAGTGLSASPNPIITTGTISLANTAVVAATYGNATNVPQITIDAQGRITSAANVAITGLGNVVGPGSSTVGNVATWNNTGGTLVANTAPGALSVLATSTTTARTLAARAAEVFNVLDFGAVCNGVTDDTTAIQAAVTAAAVAGGDVTFPKGFCQISGTITVANNSVTLTGQGSFTTVLNCTGSGTANCLVLGNQVSTVYYTTVRSLGISATSRTGGHCLYIHNTSIAIVENVFMINCFNSAKVEQANNTSMSNFNMTGVNGSYALGFITGANDLVRSDVLSLNRGVIQANFVGSAIGIAWDGASYGLWIDDVVILQTNYALVTQNTAASATHFPSFLFANHLEIEGAKLNAIRFSAGYGFVLNNSYVVNNHGASGQGSADSHCITMEADTGVTNTSLLLISNTQIGYCADSAIFIGGRNVQINNVNTRQISMTGTDPVIGIDTTALDVTINNLNTFQTGDTVNSAYAVVITGTPSRINLCGIDGRGATTGLISGSISSMVACAGMYSSSNTITGIGIGVAPASDAAFNATMTAAGADRAIRLTNASSTAGTVARLDLATGTANAYTLIKQNESGGGPFFSLATGAGNTLGIFLDSSAAAAAPITLIPGASSLVNVSGRIAATSYQAVTVMSFNTAPTISSGFGTSPSIVAHNGTAVFRVNVGTGGVATTGVIGLPTATTGWACAIQNISTNNATVFLTKQTATTTTTVTVGNYDAAGVAAAWTASDALLFQCRAY